MGNRWQPATFMVRMARSWQWDRDDCLYWDEREGYMYDVFGLHKGECGNDRRRGWVVTHLPTGLAFEAFARRRDAERFVRAIAPLHDWGRVTSGRRVPRAVKAAVREALARVVGAERVA